MAAVCLIPVVSAVVGAEPPPIPLMINDSGATDPARLYQGLSGVTPATIKTTGRFTWNVGSGEILNPVGDLVATVSGGDLEAQLARVQGALDKWAVVRALEQDTEHRGLNLRVEPDDSIHRRGSSMRLVISGMRYPYFTLFNLAADGTVNFIYPVIDSRLHDAPTLPLDTPYRIELQVTPPFGADHFIALSSAAVLTNLHAGLKADDGKPEALSILEMFEQNLAGQSYQFGVLGVYSGP